MSGVELTACRLEQRRHMESETSSSRLRRRARWVAVTLILLAGLEAAPNAIAQDTRPKRVLVISTGTRLAPGFILADQQILAALDAIPGGVETRAENLDVIRLPAQRAQRIFIEYLEAKYGEVPPDLIVLVYTGSLVPSAKVLEQLFPRTPIIVAGYTEEEIRPGEFGPLVSGFAQRLDARATLELMLRLQPELQRVVVIGGTADIDQELMQRVKAELQPFAQRVQIELWDRLSLAELRTRVAALPPATAVLFTRMFRDGAGEDVISSEVGQIIGRIANRPVYVLADTAFGTGAVGGAIASAEAFTRAAGDLARQVLTGTPPDSLRFEISTRTVPTFDWRALKRWQISDSRLPPNSVVQYKPQTVWEQYRGYIIAAITIIVAQMVLIVTLVLERRSRRRAQGAADENRQLIELATEAGELGLWLRNRDDESVWANAATRALFGVGVNEPLRFDNLIARVHPSDVPRVQAQVEHAHAAGIPFETEFRTRLPDGSEKWIMARGRAVGDGGRRRMGVVVDITQRKAIEIELQEKRQELAHLTRVSLLGELAASLAHELRQPLTAIQANISAALRFLEQPRGKGDVQESLEDAAAAQRRASEVINHIWSLAKREEPELTTVELATIIHDVLALVHATALNQEVDIQCEVEAGLPSIRGDRIQLEQVLLNLLLNAFDASGETPPAERRVGLSAHRHDVSTVRLAVTDRGTGIDPAHMERIFEPFYSSKSRGLGMGLSICRSIVVRHGGRIWAENNVDRGATFYFTVPVQHSDGA